MLFIDSYRFSTPTLTEKLWQSQTAPSDITGAVADGSGGRWSQKIRGIQTANISITKVIIYASHVYASGDVNISFNSAENGGGINYGSLSQTATAAGELQFSFGTPIIIPANTDFFLVVTISGGYMDFGFKSSDPYQSGNGYDGAFNGVSNVGGTLIDLFFKIYALLL